MEAHQGETKLESLVRSYSAMHELDRFDPDFTGPVVVIGDDQAACDQYRQIVEASGLRASEGCKLEDGNRHLKQQLNASAILVHLANPEDVAGLAMMQIQDFCALQNLPLILIFDISLLDGVLENITYADVEHIVLDRDGNKETDVTAEIIVALPRRVRRSNMSVFGDRDEVDVTDLKKISADVERIAKALNELSLPETGNIQREPISRSPFELDSGSQDHASGVSDAPVSFKAQDMADTQSYGFVKDDDNPSQSHEMTGRITADQIRDLIKARRLRDQYFNAELFADPAWDMLLDLMATQLEGTRVSVSSLCIAASVPPTTALRWIKTMTDEKIFVRRADEKDGRRIFIELSNEATAGMIGFFSMIRRSNLMMI